jgi:uncharacterized protein (DUF885 family)
MTTGQTAHAERLPQILNKLVLAATAKGYQQGVRDGRAGQPLIADDDTITDANIEAVEQLALDEVATLRAERDEWRDAKTFLMGAPCASVAECPTYYDGCNCTVYQLKAVTDDLTALRARVQQLEQALREIVPALEASSGDWGRPGDVYFSVERSCDVVMSVIRATLADSGR